MGKTEKLWDKLTESADLTAEAMPGQTIVEIAGENRVLVENHGGIKVYTQSEVIVNTKYGFAHICGSGLDIIRMSTETLIIKGRVREIKLQRRD